MVALSASMYRKQIPAPGEHKFWADVDVQVATFASLNIHLILLANVYHPAIMTDNPICYLEISNDIHLRMCIQLTFHFSGDEFA